MLYSRHLKLIVPGGDTMKHIVRNLSLTLGQLDRRHARLALVVLSVALFVLGAGAPSVDGN